MTTIETIKVEHERLGKLIASLTAQAKLFPLTVAMPELKEGERYVGVIVSADGTKKEHIILLPSEKEEIKWQAAMDWAASIGGELPDRVEGALLFATMKEEFKEAWHWTREQHASGSDFAWLQNFAYGNQVDGHKGLNYRARAVRRVPI